MTRSLYYDQIILFGFGFDPELLGFGASLSNIYQRRVDVFNRGFSGFNTDWSLPITSQILPTVEQQKKDESSVLLMTIFFGANDAALPFSPQHVPLERYKSNLKTMIDLVKDPQSDHYNPRLRLVLITPPPVNEVDWKKRCEEEGIKLNRTNESARMYSEAVNAVGKEKGVVVIDIWSHLMEKVNKENYGLSDFLSDGLHLTKQGYKVSQSKCMYPPYSITK
ncbi:SGNH hydrolase-type esterase domain-containing protein [Pilobolus umbonatus]|nr:SGNH hydrolase-type esterase domain-containing protein [Pilobolus umbonatus]